MDPSEGPHPDPVTGAATVGGQKLAEFITVAALLTQVTAQARAYLAARAAGREAAGEAEAGAARARWAPALHRDWLADAALPDVARAWGSALPYEQADASARDAMDAAEGRLRDLHPYAMAHYDRLRADGRSRMDSMWEAMPDFQLHPRPRPAPRDVHKGRRLGAGGGEADAAGDGYLAGAAHVAGSARILAVVARLNEESIAAGRGPLDPAVTEMALHRSTNVPAEAIDWVIRGLRDGSLVLPVPASGPARRTVSTTGTAAADWPRDVHDGLAATVIRGAAGSQPARPARQARRTATRDRAPRLHP